MLKPLSSSLLGLALLTAVKTFGATVALIGPTNSVISAPASVTFRATVDAPGVNITKVDFLSGTNIVGTVTSAPYSLTVSNVFFGKVQARAVATDELGHTIASDPLTFTVQRAVSAPLTLQILHASDFIAGIAALDDAPRFSSVLNALKAAYPTNSVVLSSGNNFIPGPFFTASADPAANFDGVKGRADITLLNSFGIQASAFGNDDFDDNTPQLRNLILPDAAVNYPGTTFPYLSANLDFSTDASLADLVTADGQDAAAIKNRIARSAVIGVAGQRIGVVGSTTPGLRTVSSPGNVGVSSNLVEIIQGTVDALLAQGINKVVLLSQLQQLTPQFDLARQLRDVDVVIAAGSETVFAKATDHLRAGDVIASPYPTTLTSASGEPVYVVNTGPNYRYVGRLILQFGTQGEVTAVDPLSGAYATDDIGVTATGNVPPDTNVVAVINRLAGIIDAKDGRRFGATDVYVNGIRDSVRSEETNLGDLTADANLARGKRTDPATVVSLKNGGGMLDSIGAIAVVDGQPARVPPPANPRVGKLAGEVSQLDIENSLRFNNSLTLLTLTAQQLRDAIEWGVAGSNLPGQFVQVGGLSFSYNPTNAPMTYARDTNGVPVSITKPGQRVQSLVVTNTDGSLDLVVDNGALVGDPARKFRAITIKYMANGGDSYLSLAQGTDKLDLAPSDATTLLFDTDGAEQKALADYLVQIKRYSQPDAGPALDQRLENLSARGDSVIAPGITRITGPNPSVVLTFTTLPGKTYRLEARDSLDLPWVPANQPPATGDGKLKTLTDATPGAPKRFYRVAVVNLR